MTIALRAIPLLLAAVGMFGQSEGEREGELKKRVVAALQVQPGATVADVGCGDGFYAIPLARFVGPSGKVFAEDIDDSALVHLRQNLIKEGLKNVDVIKGVEDDPKLPADSLDAVLIVNSYHEMPEHEAMLRHIRAALKQNGRFVLMERISDKYEKFSRVEQIKKHYIGPRFAKDELETGGFEIVKLDDHFVDFPPNTEEGASRWWLIVARKP